MGMETTMRHWTDIDPSLKSLSLNLSLNSFWESSSDLKKLVNSVYVSTQPKSMLELLEQKMIGFTASLFLSIIQKVIRSLGLLEFQKTG